MLEIGTGPGGTDNVAASDGGAASEVPANTSGSPSVLPDRRTDVASDTTVAPGKMLEAGTLPGSIADVATVAGSAAPWTSPSGCGSPAGTRRSPACNTMPVTSWPWSSGKPMALPISCRTVLSRSMRPNAGLDGFATNATLDSVTWNSLLSPGVGSTNHPQPAALLSMMMVSPIVSPSTPWGRLPIWTLTLSNAAKRGSPAPSAAVHSALASTTIDANSLSVSAATKPAGAEADATCRIAVGYVASSVFTWTISNDVCPDVLPLKLISP